MSTPNSPGGFITVRAIKSVAQIVRVPFDLITHIHIGKKYCATDDALSMMSEKSRTVPSVSGYWKMMPPMSLLEKSTVLTSTISICIPKGPALVSTQLMV